MSRYIDADKLINKIFPIGMVHDGQYTINAKAIKIAIDKTPTADVVPRAGVDELAKQHHDLIVEKDRLFDEVERLQHILDSYALQYGTVKDQQSVIVKVKSEMLSEFLRMVENVCKYEERLSYEKIKDGHKKTNSNERRWHR